jgi:hypothetical protein
MIVTEKTLTQLLKDRKKDELKVLLFNSMNINKIILKTTHFDNIEFLCLKNNNIKDITFTIYLNKLWYLDLRGNPVENFEMISYHNVFGYLGVTVDKYTIKNFLKLRKMHIGQFNMEYDLDLPTRKYFLANNPNITKFNNDFLYYTEKGNKDESFETGLHSPSPKKSSYIKNNTMFASSIFDLENTALIEQKGEKINSLRSFHETNFGEFKQLQYSYGLVNPNDTFRSDQKYLKLEKNKLVNFAKIYESFIMLKSDKSKIFSNSDKFDDTADVQFFDIESFKTSDYFPQLIVLTVLNLYILQVIRIELATSILKFFFKNLLKKKIKAETIKTLLNLDKDILLCFYYSLYEHFLTLYDQSKHKDKYKYKDIKTHLEMNKLVLLANLVKEFDTSKTIFCEKLCNEDRKLNINKLVKYFDNQLDIFFEVLTVLQFLSDFMIYHKLHNILLQYHTFEYRVFIEICFLFYNYLSSKNKQEVVFIDRDYRMHKFQILGNTLEYMKKQLLEKDLKSKIGLDNKQSTLGLFDEIALEKPKKVKAIDFTHYRLIPRGSKLPARKEYKSLVEREEQKPPIENIHEVFTTRLLADSRMDKDSVRINREILSRSSGRFGFKPLYMSHHSRNETTTASPRYRRKSKIKTLPMISKGVQSNELTPRV